MNPALKTYTIGQAAKLLGLSIETLRRYDRAGKIEAKRTPGGQRFFTDGDIESIKKYLKDKNGSYEVPAPIESFTEEIPIKEDDKPTTLSDKPNSTSKPASLGSLFNTFIYLVFFAIVLGYLYNFPNTYHGKILADNFTKTKEETSRILSNSAKKARLIQQQIDLEKQVLGVESFIAPVAQEVSPLLSSGQAILSPVFRFFSNAGNFLKIRTSAFIAALLPGPEDSLIQSFSLPEGIKVEGNNITLGFPNFGTTTVNNNFEVIGTTVLSDTSILGSLSVGGPLNLGGPITNVTNIQATGDISSDNLTVTGTINGNTLSSSTLVFSGSSPSIYPSTTNSQISLNANGTGAINIGNSGTGDVYIAGGSDSTGCTITNSNGSLNCSGNITSQADIDVRGGDLTTNQTTFNLINTTATTLNIGGAATTLNLGGSSSSVIIAGTPSFTKAPTQAHTGTWAIDSSTWNQSNATVYINPGSATADSNLLGIAVAGGVKFAIDAEGDIYGRNLILAGNTTTGTTTVSGDLNVEGNTTLGDATTDTFTINPATITLSGGNKTLDIAGAATRTLTLLNSTAGQIADLDLSDGNLKVNGSTIITNAGAGSFTTVGGTLSTAAQTNITSVGTLSGLTVTGNINSVSGALQTNSITRIDNSGNLTAGTGAFSGTVTVGGGTGKIDVGTVDPPYTIDGKKYATYLPSMTGIKEETSGVIRLDQTGKYEIDFSKVSKGSDFWLFYQVSDFGKDWENLTALLTPNFEGRVWYIKDPKNRRLTVFGSSAKEVSYRLTAPRFDYLNWPNTRNGESEGFVLSEKK